ncbi:protein phosphatase CheZ [Breoghania sp.]|uniref:protein phosphatase CheZ n=1 Tax=Breoghania sp. TaxID=2065378 RepID=UPI002AA66356|nr:protein phosphatase CheZ [Breoghania sp.]
MIPMTNHDVSGVIKFLEDNKARGGDVSLGDVMRLAEIMVGDFKGVLHASAPSMRQEFEDIATEIARMKKEVMQLRAADMKHNRIPEAGRELDAIVEATEDATQTIMQAAEEIMAADTADATAYQSMVGDKMIEIFEACAFQDITGQRISKVVKTLSYIDERVTSFVERLRIMENEEGEIEESEEERRARELILHGPQHAGEGVSQDEIDAMMGGGADQADIDKLFD